MDPEQCNNHALRQQHQRTAESRTGELLARQAGSTPTGGLSAASKTAQVVEEIFAATQPPCSATSCAVMGGSGAVSKLPELEGDFSEESPGGTSAASMASSVGAGVGLVVEPGLSIGHIGQMEGVDTDVSDSEDSDSDGEALSPLAPGRLSCHWSSPAQLAGFDKQTPGKTTAGTESLSPQDLWNQDGGDSYFGVGVGNGRPLGGRGARPLVWDYLPGETSITLGVRLYLTHLDPFVSHEENCARLLRQILERLATEELDVPVLKTRHVIKLEAFLRSVVLSVPARTWQESVRGAFARTGPVGNNRSSGHGPQMCGDELTFRMGLFISIMRVEREGGQDADAAIDDMRVESVVRGYAANAAEILPLQRPARTLLPPLLFCMACDVLVVRLLAPEIRDVCHKIVSDYEARAKLWMSPPQNAERYLRPLVTDFARWLRTNHDLLYQGSATEGLLCSIDDRLRNTLKHQVYRSPGHFLSVLKSLSDKLTDMPLPSYDPSGGDNDHPFDVSQTLKDVSRERFDVNKIETDPADCWRKIRALLLKAAKNHPSYTNGTTGQSDQETETVLRPSPGLAAHTGHPSKHASSGNGTADCAASGSVLSAAATGDAATGDAGSADAAGGGNGVSAGAGRGGAGGVVGKAWGVGSDKKGGVRGNDNASKSELDMYVDQCAWRVLHAASRTASGGDCFFVVQDLFGGEGVLVKMATAATEPIRIRTEGLAARVTTVDKHDIYHISDVDMGSASPRPLMTITTTMKEVVQFAPFHEAQSRQKSRSLPGESDGFGLDEPENKQPEHVTSGRFITISADLPTYPEHHLDASAGVLEAPLKQEQAPQDGCLDESNGPGEAAVVDKSDSSPPPNDAAESAPSTPTRPPAIDSASNLARTRQRPSTFRSPAPTSPMRSSKLIGALGNGKGVEAAFNWEGSPEPKPKPGSGKKGRRRR